MDLLPLTELEDEALKRVEEAGNGVLAREILDLVSVYAAWLAAEVPGFAVALSWSA